MVLKVGQKVAILTIGLLAGASVLSTTACSSSILTGSDVVTSSYPQVPPPVPPERGSAHPPGWWPAGVPVASGRYRELHSALINDGTRILEVSEMPAGGVESASELLVAAGYESQDFLGQQAFIGIDHMVTVVMADNGFGEILIYTLSDSSALSVLPELADLDLGALLGDAG